ncbi:hypothetical protein D3C72_1148280 [compost metagenome]
MLEEFGVEPPHGKRQGFENDAVDFLGTLAQHAQAFWMAVLEDNGVVHRFVRGAGTACHRLGPLYRPALLKPRADHGLVGEAVVLALAFRHLSPLPVGAANAQRLDDGLRSRIREAGVTATRERIHQQPGKFNLRRVADSVQATVRHGRLLCGDNCRMRVAEDVRPVATGQIDIAIAVDVFDLASLGPAREHRIGAGKEVAVHVDGRDHESLRVVTHRQCLWRCPVEVAVEALAHIVIHVGRVFVREPSGIGPDVDVRIDLLAEALAGGQRQFDLGEVRGVVGTVAAQCLADVPEELVGLPLIRDLVEVPQDHRLDVLEELAMVTHSLLVYDEVTQEAGGGEVPFMPDRREEERRQSPFLCLRHVDRDAEVEKDDLAVRRETHVAGMGVAMGDAMHVEHGVDRILEAARQLRPGDAHSFEVPARNALHIFHG